MLSANCTCLHVKFAKDFSNSFCRELFNVFRYSFFSGPSLKVKTIFFYSLLCFLDACLLSREMHCNFETNISYQKFLTLKNFNRVRSRLLGFLGYSLIDKDSYIFFADLGEARSHTYCNKARLLYSTEKFSRTTTIHPGIFRGRALFNN